MSFPVTPFEIVTPFAAYDTPYYAVAAIQGPVSPAGQFGTGGSAYNQVNVQYVNSVPALDLGTLLPPITEETAVKGYI